MDNAICDYSTPNFDDIDPQVIFSRPLKLDAAETLKTVYTAIQRGHFRKGAVMTVLQGSRDLYNWFTIASSKDHAIRRIAGTPYKFFRLMLLCNLQKDESILGCSLQVNPKYTNRLR
jgi:ketol-acid reductoisomerase